MGGVGESEGKRSREREGGSENVGVRDGKGGVREGGCG